VTISITSSVRIFWNSVSMPIASWAAMTKSKLRLSLPMTC
jgi:hypothetical protein